MNRDLKLVLMIKIIFKKMYYHQFIQQDFQKIKNQDKTQMNQITQTMYLEVNTKESNKYNL